MEKYEKEEKFTRYIKCPKCGNEIEVEIVIRIVNGNRDEVSVRIGRDVYCKVCQTRYEVVNEVDGN